MSDIYIDMNRKATPANKTELTSYIDKTLKKEFKLACTEAEVSMSAIVEELIQRWINERNSNK